MVSKSPPSTMPEYIKCKMASTFSGAGLWNLKDIQNLRQKRSRNKLIRDNTVTLEHGICSLRVMGS